jgi:hypothetical protein
MKKISNPTLLNLLALMLILFGSAAFINQNTESEKQKTKSESMEKSAVAKKQLRHVVLFKFKESATAEDIATIEKAFAALPGKIPQIKSYEWGINNSPEGLDKGFTHCFFLTFKSEEDRAIYLPHPDHKAFGSLLGPHLDDVLVLDYWAE